MAKKLHSAVLFLFLLLTWLVSVYATGQNLLGCQSTSPNASTYSCRAKGSVSSCSTFAILRVNPFFASLSNLTTYLGLNRFSIADSNGLSPKTEFVELNQLLLIPIECICNGGGDFESVLKKTSVKGESFNEISQSLGGLSTCKAIKDRNIGIKELNLADKIQVSVPISCSCPSLSDKAKLLVSYPVSEGDTVSKLAVLFNVTQEAVLSVNNRQSKLVPFTTVLVPVNAKPVLVPTLKPNQSNNPARSKKLNKNKLYIALTGIAIAVSIAITTALVLVRMKRANDTNKQRRNKRSLKKDRDLEQQQQLSLSIRTTSDKKISFEGSIGPLDCQIFATTPRKSLVETYTLDELKKATDDFSLSNHIEGSIYHGRLNGLNIAVKRVKEETLAKIEFDVLKDSTFHHPNIIKLLGMCLNQDSEEGFGFLVFEYAENGALSDWLHGGLAMKNQFIASCYCFLNWHQRLKICYDVALGLQFMHQSMNPSYVHKNIKSSNIFLDEDFVAKIGDLGMSGSHEDQTDETNYGYLSPEYVEHGLVSPSMDVYGYGVVLLEVLSGKRNGKKEEGSVWVLDKAEDLKECIDSALGETYCFDDAVALANLGMACVEEDPLLRPSVAEIVEKLCRLVEGEKDEVVAETEQVLVCESSSKPLVVKDTHSTM